MSCENINNCPGEVLSSNCIIWEGEDIPCLGIEKGQSITQLENALAVRVCQLLTDVDISQVVLCDDLITLMSDRSKTIANLFQVMNDYTCSLKDIIDGLTGETDATNPLTLDYKCLDVVIDPCDDTDFNLQNILQILINNFCTLKTAFSTLETNVNTTINNSIFDALSGTLQTCQTNRIVSDPVTKKVTLRGFVPPMCPIPYVGSLAFFDGSGKGLDSGPMCGWYICNGLNGTPDYRGRVLVGAIQGISGNTLSSDVDPSLAKNAGANYSLGDTGGEVKHKLSVEETALRAHTHTVNDSGHSHTVLGMTHNLGGDGDGNEPRDTSQGGIGDYFTDTKKTGITIDPVASSPASAYHENRMPYKAVYYIMMLS